MSDFRECVHTNAEVESPIHGQRVDLSSGISLALRSTLQRNNVVVYDCTRSRTSRVSSFFIFLVSTGVCSACVHAPFANLVDMCTRGTRSAQIIGHNGGVWGPLSNPQ